MSVPGTLDRLLADHVKTRRQLSVLRGLFRVPPCRLRTQGPERLDGPSARRPGTAILSAVIPGGDPGSHCRKAPPSGRGSSDRRSRAVRGWNLSSELLELHLGADLL